MSETAAHAHGAACAASADGTRVLYLVHDVHDAAVARRVEMLERGGAKVVVAGFRRRREQLDTVSQSPVVDLGRTRDAKLAARAASVAKVLAFDLTRISDKAGAPDAIIARNLEMLVIASALRRGAYARSTLVYECLDVHRAMLGQGLRAGALRAIERRLLEDSSLLVVSSAAFMAHYFEPLQSFQGRWRLVENKVLAPLSTALTPVRAPSLGPPWRIGWFGVLRCQRSLDLLCALVARHPQRFEIVVGGRPALHEFRDFHGQIGANPGVSFIGPYTLADLPMLYSRIHFCWAVDYFDAGANSDWLLPNRFYEAGAHGVPVIARRHSELDKVARGLGCAVAIDPDEDSDWERELDLGKREYALLREKVAAHGKRFVSHQGDCEDLVRAITTRADVSQQTEAPK